MTLLQIALEALRRIASPYEGESPDSDPDSTFDEPKSATTARRALRDIAACPRIPLPTMLSIGHRALLKTGREVSEQEGVMRIGYAVEAYLRKEKP